MGIFDNCVAWFSNSVSNRILKLWEQHGGEFSNTFRDKNVIFCFCDNIQSNDIQEIIQEGELLLFESQWIQDCVQENQMLTIQPYILADSMKPKYHESTDPPNLDDLLNTPEFRHLTGIQNEFEMFDWKDPSISVHKLSNAPFASQSQHKPPKSYNKKQEQKQPLWELYKRRHSSALDTFQPPSKRRRLTNWLDSHITSNPPATDQIDRHHRHRHRSRRRSVSDIQAPQTDPVKRRRSASSFFSSPIFQKNIDFS
eukprot:gb/GECH01013772.1/.p1 GENE.gb/GECH01013772.1/~~gb/GECH01013772.1/.p1  ORF type:complete len:255 (+),score=63.41 gb/GECH01013772.1/:1-765(+)